MTDGDLAAASEFLLYTTRDGDADIEVRLIDETVWLSQVKMAELFDRDVRTISEHIRTVFFERELEESAVIRKFRITAADGKSYDVVHYNLDVIISVGYRVKSLRGTQFRIWATERLRDYIVKGFLLNDARFKRDGGHGYFEELLERIRDIRSSEKVFYRKVLDLFATSLDYQSASDETRRIFATAQNKLHWATHRHTAAEIIHERADATRPSMGLTSWDRDIPRKSDTEIAKNYLSFDELGTLNRLVNAYLEIAELRARNRQATYMRDWLGQLDQVLSLAGHEILDHAGSISMDLAKQKAALEYDSFHRQRVNSSSQIDKDFDAATRFIRKIKPPADR